MAAEARIVHPSALALQAHLLAVVVAVLTATVCVGVVCRCRAMLSVVIRIVSVVTVVALVASPTATSSTPVATSIAIAAPAAVVPAVSATSTISMIVSIIVMAAASPAPATASIPAIITVIATFVAIAAPPIVMMMVIVMMGIVSLGMRVVDQGSIGILHLSVLASILSFATSRSIRCVLADLVSDLAACSSTAELPVRLEPVVPVHADHATIEHRPVESVHGEGGLGPRGILDEAEAAGLHLDAVEAHDQIDDLPASREKLEQLGLQGEERQVADIESCRSFESLRVIFLGKTCTNNEAKRLIICWANEFVVTFTYLSAYRNT